MVHHIKEAGESAEQVNAMHRREEEEERAARTRGKRKTLLGEIAPSQKLPNEEEQSEQQRDVERGELRSRCGSVDSRAPV
jgi:hypothetical protein